MSPNAQTCLKRRHCASTSKSHVQISYEVSYLYFVGVAKTKTPVTCLTTFNIPNKICLTIFRRWHTKPYHECVSTFIPKFNTLASNHLFSTNPAMKPPRNQFNPIKSACFLGEPSWNLPNGSYPLRKCWSHRNPIVQGSNFIYCYFLNILSSNLT